MHDFNLIQDFAILLLAAGGAGLVCRRFGLSVIVGYLLAGILIGPYTPPFSLILDEGRILALSQVGLVFLMFGIGLGLSLSKFARLGAGMAVATALSAMGVLGLTQTAAVFFDWTSLQTLFIAAMLMCSSSAVIAKVVSEQNKIHERASQTALAMTVLEDVVAVVMLTILASQVDVSSSSSGGMGRLLGGMGAFVVLLVGAGLLLVPRLMSRLETRRDPEMQTVIVAGLLFAMALVAAQAGYSLALGAFLFGAIVAELPQRHGVETSFGGLRDMFSSVFFVSIGMMIDLRLIFEDWPMVLALSVFALVVRPLATGFALILTGTPPSEAKRAGLLLTPLGEFSFIIAQLGVTSAILSAAYYPVVVGASILTVLVTPVMSLHRGVLVRITDRLEPRWLTLSIEAYHEWITQILTQPSRTPIWKLLRPRLGQVAVELLFVSGLLTFSEVLLNAVGELEFMQRFGPSTVAYVFWSLVTVLVLTPILAIWRNCSALSMLLSELWESRHLPRGLLEHIFKTIVMLGLLGWIYLLLPHAPFAQWGWLIIVSGALVIVARFSRRLVFWHSQLHFSMREVLADRSADRNDLRVEARASLGKNLDRWNVVLSEATLPLNTSLAGQSLAELRLPSQHGCAVIEIERNGHSIDAPTGDAVLYPGDKVLFIGPVDQAKAVCAFLETENAIQDEYADLTGVVLDTCVIGKALEGEILGDLDLARRAGIRIAAIQRGSQRIINPLAEERLNPGDEILILGTLENIRRFRREQSIASGSSVSAIPSIRPGYT